MAPPSWLPPLNSHSNYDMCVVASQIDESRKNESGKEPVVHLKITVSAIFSSDDPWGDTTLEGLSMVRTSTLLSHTIDSPAECERSIKSILADMDIPLEFDELTWRHRHLNGDEVHRMPRVQDVDTLIEKVCEFLYEAKTQPHNKDFTFLPVNLTIVKRIAVPDAEFEAWLSWYDEMSDVNPDFEAEYERAISRPRTEDELLYAQSLRFNAATDTATEPLKLVRIEDSSLTRSCSVCLEESGAGSRAI